MLGLCLSARDCRRRKLSASRSELRGAVMSSWIALCKVPLRQATNTTGLMYDLRQTAGVLRSSAATLFTAATMHSFSARSLGLSGSGVATMSAMARNVAPQVRKSLAVKSAPMTSRKYAFT